MFIGEEGEDTWGLRREFWRIFAADVYTLTKMFMTFFIDERV